MMEFFNRNLMAKIIALIVAVILWFFVMNEQNPAIDSTFTIPLEVQNAPEGYMVEKGVETIKLKVRGPRSLFALAGEKDFKAYADLNGITEGKHSVKVQTVLPQGFDLVTASPETVIFDVDKIIRESYRVDLAFSGSPDGGLTIGNAVPSVKEVNVEGPSAAVGAVSRVVGYVSLAGKDSDFSAAVPLVAVNSEGKEVSDVRLTPGSVNVDVSMVKGLYKKYVDVKPSVANDLPERYLLNSIRIEPAKIDIFGDQRIVEKLDFIETETISLADLTKPVTKEVKLKLPIGITVTNDTVTVKIDITEQPAE